MKQRGLCASVILILSQLRERPRDPPVTGNCRLCPRAITSPHLLESGDTVRLQQILGHEELVAAIYYGHENGDEPSQAIQDGEREIEEGLRRVAEEWVRKRDDGGRGVHYVGMGPVLGPPTPPRVHRTRPPAENEETYCNRLMPQAELADSTETVSDKPGAIQSSDRVVITPTPV